MPSAKTAASDDADAKPKKRRNPDRKRREEATASVATESTAKEGSVRSASVRSASVRSTSTAKASVAKESAGRERAPKDGSAKVSTSKGSRENNKSSKPSKANEKSKDTDAAPKRSKEKDAPKKSKDKEAVKKTKDKDAVKKSKEKDVTSKKKREKDAEPTKSKEKDAAAKSGKESDATVKKSKEKDSTAKKRKDEDRSAAAKTDTVKSSKEKDTTAKESSGKSSKERSASVKKVKEKSSASKNGKENDGAAKAESAKEKVSSRKTKTSKGTRERSVKDVPLKVLSVDEQSISDVKESTTSKSGKSKDRSVKTDTTESKKEKVSSRKTKTSKGTRDRAVKDVPPIEHYPEEQSTSEVRDNSVTDDTRRSKHRSIKHSEPADEVAKPAPLGYPSGAVPPEAVPEDVIQPPQGYPQSKDVDDGAYEHADPVMESKDDVAVIDEAHVNSNHLSSESGGDDGSEFEDGDDRHRRRRSKHRGHGGKRSKKGHRGHREHRERRHHSRHEERPHHDELLQRQMPIMQPLDAPVHHLTPHGISHSIAQERHMQQRYIDEVAAREEQEYQMHLDHERQMRREHSRRRRSHSRPRRSKSRPRNSRRDRKRKDRREHQHHSEDEAPASLSRILRYNPEIDDDVQLANDDGAHQHSEHSASIRHSEGSRHSGDSRRSGSLRSGAAAGAGLMDKFKSAAEGVKSAAANMLGSTREAVSEEKHSGIGHSANGEHEDVAYRGNGYAGAGEGSVQSGSMRHSQQSGQVHGEVVNTSRSVPQFTGSGIASDIMPSSDHGDGGNSDSTAPSGDDCGEEEKQVDSRPRKSKSRRNIKKNEAQDDGSGGIFQRRRSSRRSRKQRNGRSGKHREGVPQEPGSEQAFAKPKSRGHGALSDADELDSLASRRARVVMQNAEAPGGPLGILEKFLPARSVPSSRKAGEMSEEQGFLELPEMGENEILADDALMRNARTGAFRVLVPEKFSYIVERRGKYKKRLDCGWHVLMPFIDQVAFVHSLREEPMTLSAHHTFSRDGISVLVGGVLFVRVCDPVAASYAVDNPYRSLLLLAQACINNAIGKRDIRDALAARPDLGGELEEEINDQARIWGLYVSRIEITELDPPSELKAMLQMEVEGRLQADVERHHYARHDEKANYTGHDDVDHDYEGADYDGHDDYGSGIKGHSVEDHENEAGSNVYNDSQRSDGDRHDKDLKLGSHSHSHGSSDDFEGSQDEKLRNQALAHSEAVAQEEATYNDVATAELVDIYESHNSSVQPPAADSLSEAADSEALSLDPTVSNLSEVQALGSSWFTGGTANTRRPPPMPASGNSSNYAASQGLSNPNALRNVRSPSPRQSGGQVFSPTHTPSNAHIASRSPRPALSPSLTRENSGVYNDVQSPQFTSQSPHSRQLAMHTRKTHGASTAGNSAKAFSPAPHNHSSRSSPRSRGKSQDNSITPLVYAHQASYSGHASPRAHGNPEAYGERSAGVHASQEHYAALSPSMAHNNLHVHSKSPAAGYGASSSQGAPIESWNVSAGLLPPNQREAGAAAAAAAAAQLAASQMSGAPPGAFVITQGQHVQPGYVQIAVPVTPGGQPLRPMEGSHMAYVHAGSPPPSYTAAYAEPGFAGTQS